MTNRTVCKPRERTGICNYLSELQRGFAGVHSREVIATVFPVYFVLCRNHHACTRARITRGKIYRIEIYVYTVLSARGGVLAFVEFSSNLRFVVFPRRKIG